MVCAVCCVLWPCAGVSRAELSSRSAKEASVRIFMFAVRENRYHIGRSVASSSCMFHNIGRMLLPGLRQVTVDCRTLPGQDEDYVLDHVRRALGPTIADDHDHCLLSVK